MKYGKCLTKYAAFHLIILPLTLLFCQIAWAYPLPDTGQTKCYNNTGEITCPQPGEAFYGQDGSYLINPPSYTKLDGAGNDLPDSATSWIMVRDNVTELIWEVKTDDGSIHDKDNKYTWYDSNPATNGGDAGTPGDGTDTEDFINALNGDNFGGHSDWRLPTIKELTTITDRGRVSPTINTGYFPNTMHPYEYWSSTTAGTSGAWGVEFHYSYANVHPKNYSHYVRAVRGGQSGLLDHLVINGDGTVTDTASGLMWQQATESGKGWADALSYCEGLSLGGYTGWRLPNIRELKSIRDYGTSNPAINSSGYWSSTTYAYITSGVWGDDVTWAKSFYHYVRAVRGGQLWLFDHLFILAPVQGAVWKIGETMPIKWETRDISGDVSISISREGGKPETFEPIIETTGNDGSFDWDIEGAKSVNCVLKIEPVDDDSKGTTQGMFSISGNPKAVTDNATSITANSATLNGTIHPYFASTTVTFEYGTDTNYGSTASADQSPVSGATEQSVNKEVTGLDSGITYHFRVKAVNSLGTTYGDDQTFTTLASAPTASTAAATATTANSATLNGQVSSNGASTTVTFEYGLTTQYGNTVEAAESPLPETASQGVTANLSGLTSGQTYHYRVKAANSVGTTYGSDQTFTTQSTAPAAETGSASGLTSSSATLTGTVNAHGASTTVTFEYGLTTSYGGTVTAGESPVTGATDQALSAEVTGLNLVTTYHYRVKATNSYGTTYGDDQTFTTLAAAPTTTTTSATSIASGSATLNGTVNPNAADTTVTFEYGITVSYGSSLTAIESPLTGTADQAVSASLTGLTPGTTYHFRAKAVNSVGTSYGDSRTFTTLASAPTPNTGLASSITSASAMLNGTVNPHGALTTVTFDYGTTTAYGSTATAAQSPLTGATAQSVSAGIAGLNPGIPYHFRVKAVNSLGTTYGDDRTFPTLAAVPTTTTTSATSITSGSATLNGTVNPNAADTTVTFDYGITVSYGSSLTAIESPLTGTADQAVSAGLTGLTPGTTYHFRAKATNSVGTTFGSDQSFIYPAMAPTVATGSASTVSAGSATLNGTVNPNGASTTYYFEYGTT